MPDAPTLPFTLRVPTDRTPNADGAELNSGRNYVAIKVIADPFMEGRGECRQDHAGPVIALREWNEQVFLHELLHVVAGYAQPLLVATYPPHGHEVISRIEVALWETGWRLLAPSSERVCMERVGCHDYRHGTDCPRYDWPRSIDAGRPL